MTTSTVKVEWTMPDDASIWGMAVYYRPDSSPSWRLVGKYSGTSCEVKDLDVLKKYHIGVAPLALHGFIAPERFWAIETITPKGSTSAPPAPTDFSATQDGERLAFEWDYDFDKVPLFDRFVITRGSTWADSRTITAIRPKIGKFSWPWEASGSQTYRIRAYDTYGQMSAEDTVTITITDTEEDVAGAEEDEDGGGFTGTKTNCAVAAGDLVTTLWGVPADGITINADDWTFSPRGPAYAEYETAQHDLGSTRTVRIALDMDVEVDTSNYLDQNASELVESPQLPVFDGADALVDRTDPETVLDPWRQLVTTDLEPVRIDKWIKLGAGAWQRYTPGLYTTRYYTLKVWMWMLWNRHRKVKISKLRSKEWKRNLKDEGSVAVVADPGPTTITFAVAFIDVPSVVAISDSPGFTVNVASVTTTGAVFRVFENLGVSSEVFTGNIYWIAAGT